MIYFFDNLLEEVLRHIGILLKIYYLVTLPIKKIRALKDTIKDIANTILDSSSVFTVLSCFRLVLNILLPDYY